MRDIKFRGFYPYWHLYEDMKNGWIFGHLGKDIDGEYYIQPEGDRYGEGYQVLKETVGQYTECKDKNGNEIYEKDILLLPCGDKAVVSFQNGTFGILWNGFKPVSECSYFQHYEKIGNIYENPELLEGSTC